MVCLSPAAHLRSCRSLRLRSRSLDKQETTRLLLDCGANIHEINCIRKHISLLKGGGLARLAYPATVLTLILSDVIGDDLDVIGSGPTVP